MLEKFPSQALLAKIRTYKVGALRILGLNFNVNKNYLNIY